MKTLAQFLLVLLATLLIVGVVAVVSYNHEMAPTWAEIERNNASIELSIKLANAPVDIETHQAMAAALGVGSWVLVGLALAIGGVMFVYVPWHKRQESIVRMVDGAYVLQKEISANGRIVYLDPNKPAFGALGFDKMTGTVLTDAELIGPDRQIEYVNNVQRTRTMAAKQIPERTNRTSAMAEAGVFDEMRRERAAKAQLAENRLLSQTPALDDGDPIAPVEMLTLKQAVERSTPDAWVIGQNPDTGKLAYFKPDEAIHLAILGATGTGKTESTGMLIVGHALRNGYRVMILDGKGGADWSKFKRWCEYVDTDSSNFVESLTPVMDEYSRRSELVKFENAPKFQPMLVLIEEYGDINDSLRGEVKASANAILDTLIRKARNTNIHLVFIDQYPEKWEAQLLNNTKNKVVYWLNDGTIVKEFKVYTLAEQGEFFLKGEKYKAWHVKPMVRNFLADVPLLDTKRVPSGVPSGVPLPVPSPLQERPPTPTEQGNAEQEYTPTELQERVWAWRDAHTEGTQAELRAEFECIGIEISKTHVHRCWHSWPGNGGENE